MTFEPGFSLLQFIPEGENVQGVPKQGQKKMWEGGGGGSHPIAQGVNIFLKNHKKYSYTNKTSILAYT